MSTTPAPTHRTFTVAVFFTDRTRLADGSYRTFTAKPQVLAASRMDAALAAIQLATAIRGDLDVMPLGHQILD